MTEDELIKKYRRHSEDVGSVEVIIIRKSFKARKIRAHCFSNKKDVVARRLHFKFSKEINYLKKYLEKKNKEKYKELILDLVPIRK